MKAPRNTFDQWLLTNHPAYWELKPRVALLAIAAVTAMGLGLGMIYPVEELEAVREITEFGTVFGLLVAFASCIGLVVWLWKMHQHRVERQFGRLSLAQDYVRMLAYLFGTFLLFFPSLLPNAVMVYRVKQTFQGDFTKDVDTMNRFFIYLPGVDGNFTGTHLEETDSANYWNEKLTFTSVIGAEDKIIYEYTARDLADMRANPDMQLIADGLKLAEKYGMEDAIFINPQELATAFTEQDLHILSGYDWDVVKRKMNMFHALVVEGEANYDYFSQGMLILLICSFVTAQLIYSAKKAGIKSVLLGIPLAIIGMPFFMLFLMPIGFIGMIFSAFSIAAFTSSHGHGGFYKRSTANLFVIVNLVSPLCLAVIITVIGFLSDMLFEASGYTLTWLSWFYLFFSLFLYFLIIFPFIHKASKRLLAVPRLK